MKKFMIIIALFITSSFQIKASTNLNIFIYSDELPYHLIAEIKDDEVLFHVYSKQLSSLQGINDIETIQAIIDQNYDKSSTHYVEIHLDKIKKATASLTSMKEVKHYGASIVDSIHFSMLFNLSDYIETNLNLKDCFDIYQIIKDKPKTSYIYQNYLTINDHQLSLK